jgi:hypothetical protein
MDVILNEVTYTVHKCEKSMSWADSNLQTECGIHHHLAHDNLEITTVEESNTMTSADKCGRCFENEGGY